MEGRHAEKQETRRRWSVAEAFSGSAGLSVHIVRRRNASCDRGEVDVSPASFKLPLRPRRYWHSVRSLFGAENAYPLVLASLVGALTGLAVVGFRALIDAITALSFGSGSVLEGAKMLPWPVRLALPAVGVAIAWVLSRLFTKDGEHHGVPEVMEAVALKGGRLRSRVMVINALASSITIGTGGSVGREDPTIHIGSSIGSTVGQLFRLDDDHTRLLVACGAAAGLAAAFNAPVGGVIFAVEIILGSAAIRAFSPIVVSSVIATAVTRWLLGDAPAFRIPGTYLESGIELVNYTVLGLIAGLAGVAFIRLLYGIEDRLAALPSLATPLVGGLLVGVIGLVAPAIYGLGYESIDTVLHQPETMGLLALLVVAKMFATSLTLGGGGSGGVLVPSLFIGAMLGGLWGDFVNQVELWPTAAPPAYALVGMAAVVAAALHAPLTAIIVIFELTGSYGIILPVMLASIVASIVSITIQPESIYTMKLYRRGIHLREHSRASAILRTLLSDVMSEAQQRLEPGLPFGETVDRVLASAGSFHYVVDDEGHLLGLIHLNQIKNLIRENSLDRPSTAADGMVRETGAIRVNDTIETCLKRFSESELPELPVVDEDGKLSGVIRRRDILDLYNRKLLNPTDLGLVFLEPQEGMETGRSLELPEGYAVDVIKAAPAFVGQALRDLDLRGRYDVLVLGIRHEAEDGSIHVFGPDPDTPLDRDAVLIVEGPREQLNRLRKLGSEGTHT